MTPLNLLLLKLAFFAIAVPLGGYFLLRLIDLIQDAWKTNNRRKKWVAASLIFGVYLILTGLFL